jgi:hypothetical protein
MVDFTKPNTATAFCWAVANRASIRSAYWRQRRIAAAASSGNYARAGRPASSVEWVAA